MAIDSARRRKSMLKWAGGVVPVHVFFPTGTVDAQARATLLGRYGGIAFDVPVIDPDSAMNMAQAQAVTIVKKMAFELTDIRHDSP